MVESYVSVGLIMHDVVERSDRVKMIEKETGEVVYTGFACQAPKFYDYARVKRFYVDIEVTAKDWKERGLAAPIEPEEPRDYCLRDLDIKFYKVIEF